MDSITQILLGLLPTVLDYTLFFGAGIAGMIGHQIKKWIRDKSVDVTFITWLKAHPKQTVSALMAYGGAALGIINADMVEMGTGAALYLSATTGFAADSTMNKSPSNEDYSSHGRIEAAPDYPSDMRPPPDREPLQYEHDNRPLDYDLEGK